MKRRLPERTTSRRRRAFAVVVLVLATLVAAFVGRWMFWVGLFLFAAIAIADLFMRSRSLESQSPD
jgi:fatty acid desaturase